MMQLWEDGQRARLGCLLGNAEKEYENDNDGANREVDVKS